MLPRCINVYIRRMQKKLTFFVVMKEMGSLYTSHLIAGTNTLLKIKFLNVKQIKKHT